jgi:hypothetical protein
MIIIIMRGENFVAHRYAAEHRFRITGFRKVFFTIHKWGIVALLWTEAIVASQVILALVWSQGIVVRQWET